MALFQYHVMYDETCLMCVWLQFDGVT